MNSREAQEVIREVLHDYAVDKAIAGLIRANAATHPYAKYILDTAEQAASDVERTLE